MQGLQAESTRYAAFQMPQSGTEYSVIMHLKDDRDLRPEWGPVPRTLSPPWVCGVRRGVWCTRYNNAVLYAALMRENAIRQLPFMPRIN